MSILGSILSKEEPDVIYECRSCGKTVDGEDAVCPYCGPTDVVCYELT